MLRAIAVIACVLACYVTASQAEDDLDARIARIERENAQLKKMLKVQDLERENAVLRARVASGRPSVADAAAKPAASASPTAVPVHTRSPASASAGGARVVTVHNEASATFAKYLPAEPLPITKRWQGFYIGGHAGMGWGSWGAQEQFSPYDLTAALGGPFVLQNSSAPLKLSSKGAVVGGQAGYSWQVGNVALGVEADLSASTIGAAARRVVSTSVNCGFPPCGGGIAPVQADASVHWLSSFRGKLGWTDDRWHLFVGAGLAAAGMSNQVTAGGITPSTIKESSVIVGYAMGSGLAYALNPQVAFRAEYLRYQFPDLNQMILGTTTTLAFPGPITPPTTYSNINVSTNVIRVGVDWRFY